MTVRGLSDYGPGLARGQERGIYRVLQRLAIGLFVVALPVLIVTSTVRVLVSDAGFYKRGLREHDAAARTGLSLAELDRAAQEIVRYWEDDALTLRILVEVDGREESLFSDKETSHMRDVKSLVHVLFLVQEATLIYVMAYVAGVFLWMRERGIRVLAWQCLGGLAFGAAFVGSIGAFALFGFDAAWTRFHEIAFRNDLWQLDPDTDRLIQMFPEPFWEEATLIAGVASLVIAAALALLAGGYLVASRPRSAGPSD